MKSVFASLCIALSTYSKLPCPQVAYIGENKRYALCFFPIVGLIAGTLLSAWLRFAAHFSLGAFPAGAVGSLIPLLVSGGIHMDGMMDTLDALACNQGVERRLDILKDSHTGAFAVMGVCAYLLLDAAFLSGIEARSLWALVPAYALSRCLSALNLLTLPSARSGGMADDLIRSSHQKRVRIGLLLQAILYALLVLFCARAGGAILLGTGALFTLWFRRMARKQFGGMTGDLAGYFLQGFELVCAAALFFYGTFFP